MFCYQCEQTAQGKACTQVGVCGKQPETAAAGKGRKTKQRNQKSKDPTGRMPGWTFATLVVSDGVVLSCDGRLLRALDARSGKQLWQCEAKTPFGKTPSVDILVEDERQA